MAELPKPTSHPLLVIESPAQLHTLVPQSHELITVRIDILASVLPGESEASNVALPFSDQPEIYHLPSRPRTSLLLQKLRTSQLANWLSLELEIEAHH